MKMGLQREVTARTKVLGVIGSPITHVSSPQLHNRAFAMLGLDYVYVALDVSLENLEAAVRGIRAMNIRGCNVAKPNRWEIAQYLDAITPAAKMVGAVNMVINDDGKLTGHMTDGMGYVYGLQEEGVAIKGKKMTILGAGGAGTAIQIQCALDGIRELSIFDLQSGMYPHAQETAEKIRRMCPECLVQVYPLEDTVKLYEEIADSDILTDATVVGFGDMVGQTNIADPKVLRKDLVVTTSIYNPKKTKLLQDAETNGCKVINGLNMLVGQAAVAFEMWVGQKMPVKRIIQELYTDSGKG